jgi:polysaccharide chain length determinant protein (PEP-CTERM system associated)
MNLEQRQQLKNILNILLRRKKIIIACLLVAVAVGLAKYMKTPKRYRSSALIAFQQTVNPSLVVTRSQSFQDTLGAVTQQITSRSSLETLINQFDLYKGMRAHLPMEDVVEIMRSNHISIRPSKQGGIFTVSYKGDVPRTVLLVTNALSARFIEENIRLREETVAETSAYIRDELAMAKETLNRKEAAMREYKLKYYNEMPDQRGTNIERLNSLQTQYQATLENIQELERTRVMIQEQISLREEILSQMILKNTSYRDPVLSGAAQLAQLEAQLDELLLRYTEKHPQVRKLKSIIAQKKESQKPQDEEADSGPGMGDPQILRMQQQVTEVNYRLGKLNKQIEEMEPLLERYAKWIEAAPMREAEWTDLTRDYKHFQNHYSGLVAKSIQADSAESLERRQKGSQFKIIDPAHFPEKPFSPDFRKIMLMALGIGLGLGCAISFFLEFLDTSFRDAHDLEKFLGLPVTCSIPVILTVRDQRRLRVRNALWLTVFIVSVAALGGGIAYLFHKGLIVI